MTKQKLIGILQLLLATLCLIVVMATLYNFANIVMRPDSVSVANTFVGQSVMIICLLAGAKILSKKGLAKIRDESVDRTVSKKATDENH